MKTLFTLLLSVMFLFLAHSNAVACSLSPTAKIAFPDDQSVHYAGDNIVFDGTTSKPFANCGSIDQYRWRLNGSTISWSSTFTHNFSLSDGQSEQVHSIELRVRNTAGKYNTKTIQITVTRNNKSLYYLTDHLGSVRVTVNEQGDPVGWDDYYPFGLQMPGRTQNASNPNDDQKFTGYELEQQGDLGIYHAGARMYDPVIGRFTSQDRFKEKYPSMSPYQYAALNPINIIDVNGDSLVNIDITGTDGLITSDAPILIDHRFIGEFLSLISAAVAHDINVHINSTFRSTEKQGRDEIQIDGTTPASVDGSRHVAGLAIDFNLFINNDRTEGFS